MVVVSAGPWVVVVVTTGNLVVVSAKPLVVVVSPGP